MNKRKHEAGNSPKDKRGIWIYALIAVAAVIVIVSAICLEAGNRKAKPGANEEVVIDVVEQPQTPTPVPTETPTPTAAPPEEDMAEPTPSAAPGAVEVPHTHDWQPVYATVHHEEKTHVETVTVKEAWDEQIMTETYVCLVCGRTGKDVPEHIMADHGGDGSYSMEQLPTGAIIHHEAVTEPRVIIDAPAYDEQALDYYACACGETKKR